MVTTKELKEMLGEEGLRELAGLIVGSTAASKDPAQRDAGERAVAKLMREIGGPPASEDPRGAAYIPDVWAEAPSFHEAKEGERDWRTVCGQHLSWKATSILLPYEMAVKVGHPCRDCYPSRVDSEESRVETRT